MTPTEFHVSVVETLGVGPLQEFAYALGRAIQDRTRSQRVTAIGDTLEDQLFAYHRMEPLNINMIDDCRRIITKESCLNDLPRIAREMRGFSASTLACATMLALNGIESDESAARYRDLRDCVNEFRVLRAVVARICGETPAEIKDARGRAKLAIVEVMARVRDLVYEINRSTNA